MRTITLACILFLVSCQSSDQQLRKEASTHFDNGDYQSAATLLDSLISSGDVNYKDYYLRGSCRFNLKDFEGAINDYEKVIELGQTKDAEVYYYLGASKFYMERYDQALKDLTMAITFNPNYAEALTMRGDTYMLLGQTDSALVDLNRSIEKNMSLAGPYFSLGNHFTTISNYEQALSYYSQAIELSPKPDYLYNRGLVYYHDKDFDNAVNDFSYAISFNEDFVDAYIMRGITLDENGNSQQALTDFDKAISLDAANGFAYFNRGITRKSLGDTKAACEDFNKALELGYMEAIAKTGDCPLVQ